MWHYVVTRTGLVRPYFWKYESNFRRDYEFVYRTRALHTERVRGRWVKVRVYARREPERPPPPERWQITWIQYPCGSIHAAWHMDQTLVLREGKMTDEEAQAYCFGYMARAMTKALMESGKVLSKNWFVNLAKYGEYGYLEEVLESMGKEYQTKYTDESEGEEEILELWRCPK